MDLYMAPYMAPPISLNKWLPTCLPKRMVKKGGKCDNFPSLPPPPPQKKLYAELGKRKKPSIVLVSITFCKQ